MRKIMMLCAMGGCMMALGLNCIPNPGTLITTAIRNFLPGTTG